MKTLEKYLKALANKKRLNILKSLKYEPASVSSISEKLRISFKSASHHLLILENAEILIKKQVKSYVYYSLSPFLPEFIKILINIL